MGAREMWLRLYRRLLALGATGDETAAKRVLEEWVSEGKPVNTYDIKDYVREFRREKRYNLALQVPPPPDPFNSFLFLFYRNYPSTLEQMSL